VVDGFFLAKNAALANNDIFHNIGPQRSEKLEAAVYCDVATFLAAHAKPFWYVTADCTISGTYCTNAQAAVANGVNITTTWAPNTLRAIPANVVLNAVPLAPDVAGAITVRQAQVQDVAGDNEWRQFTLPCIADSYVCLYGTASAAAGPLGQANVSFIRITSIQPAVRRASSKLLEYVGDPDFNIDFEILDPNVTELMAALRSYDAFRFQQNRPTLASAIGTYYQGIQTQADTMPPQDFGDFDLTQFIYDLKWWVGRGTEAGNTISTQTKRRLYLKFYYLAVDALNLLSVDWQYHAYLASTMLTNNALA
jgi:hypothetical protein